jgi:hypothetical protein
MVSPYKKVVVVVCRDAPWFATLIRRGILKDDLDLRRP